MSNTMVRNAAHDGGIGAILGLLLVSGLVTSSLDMRQLLSDGREPLMSLALIISVVVTQCAVAAAFCGLFVRKFFSEGEEHSESQRLERLNRAQFHRANFQIVSTGQQLALARAEAPRQRIARSASFR